MWRKRNGVWSLLIATILLLTFSNRARSGARKALLKGSDVAIDLKDQWSGKSSKVNKSGGRKEEVEVPTYPSYVGYEAKREVSNRKGGKVRKVNPTRYNNAKNVMNDERMPYQMAEIAEEFDLN